MHGAAEQPGSAQPQRKRLPPFKSYAEQQETIATTLAWARERPDLSYEEIAATWPPTSRARPTCKLPTPSRWPTFGRYELRWRSAPQTRAQKFPMTSSTASGPSKGSLNSVAGIRRRTLTPAATTPAQRPAAPEASLPLRLPAQPGPFATACTQRLLRLRNPARPACGPEAAVSTGPYHRREHDGDRRRRTSHRSTCGSCYCRNWLSISRDPPSYYPGGRTMARIGELTSRERSLRVVPRLHEKRASDSRPTSSPWTNCGIAATEPTPAASAAGNRRVSSRT
jgi:hypothetical protein